MFEADRAEFTTLLHGEIAEEPAVIPGGGVWCICPKDLASIIQAFFCVMCDDAD